jgi:hypothetical protein
MRRSTTALTLTRIALVAALVATGSLAAATSASAEEGDVSWGVRTAANDQGAERQNYGYEIDPGAAVDDALVISNHDAIPLELSLYGADGFTTEAGELDVLTRDEESTELGAWVAFASDTVTVPAGESLEVPFSVRVPDNATPGDYAGAVITSLGRPTQDQGVSVDRRLGIRIHLRVGGELAPALAVDDMRVEYTGTANPFGPGDTAVTYTLHNTGNARLESTQSVAVSGPFGLFRAEASDIEPVPELLPGETRDVTVRLPGIVPAFLLTATTVVTLDSAGNDGSDPSIPAVEAEATTWAVPWALLALVLLVAALVVAAVVLTRRRRRTRRRLEDARVAEAVQKALLERENEPTPVA